MKNKYRVVRDSYLGYEAQVKYWWFPFIWFQMDRVNTHSSFERAADYIRNRATIQKWKRNVYPYSRNNITGKEKV